MADRSKIEVFCTRCGAKASPGEQECVKCEGTLAEKPKAPTSTTRGKTQSVR